MGIRRKASLVVALAVLAYSSAAGRPASAASPQGLPDRSSSPASRMDGTHATKRGGGPLRIALPSTSAEHLPTLTAFQERLNRELPGEVVGLYLDGRTALHVVRQPAGDPSYVSSVPGTVTLFRLAAEAGTLGFLAHSEEAGASFAALEAGDLVWVVYGDGQAEPFAVSQVERYRAEDPSDSHGGFTDLSSGEHLTAEDLFQHVYGSGHGVVLQTCLLGDGSLTWGRLFVLAEPAR